MSIAVRDYLKQYPNSGLDLLTPAELVSIPPRLGRELLSPGDVKMKFYVCVTKEKVVASTLLEQCICKIVRYRNNPWWMFILVNPSGQMPSTEVLYEQEASLFE